MSRKEKYKKSAFISKAITAVVFGGILFCLLLWRIIYICKILKKQNIVESNICDLKEFLDSIN